MLTTRHVCNDLPKSPSHLPPEVRDKHPHWTYGKLLGSLSLILLLPLGFSFYLCATGPVAAPKAITTFTYNNLGLAPQLIAAIGSTLTICVKWGFSGAITTYARKHLQQSHPVHHIELLTALKNGALVRSWDTRQFLSKIGTLTAAVLCGLLTSGFVALISPVSVEKDSPINAGTLSELDFTSPDASCSQWVENTHTPAIVTNDCSDLRRYLDTNLVYYNCAYKDLLGDDMTSAELAMTYRFTFNMSSQKVSTLVKSLPLLSNTRLIGTTAGTLPLGPRGVNVFPNSALPYHMMKISSFNYTLELQGVWAESSCKHTENSPLLVSPPGPERTVTLNCSSGDTPVLWDRVIRSDLEVGVRFGGLCYNSQSGTATFHFRTFRDSRDNGLLSVTGSGPYVNIGPVECSFAPRIGPVNATYHTDIAAFNMTRSADYISFSAMGPLAKSIVVDGMTAVLGTLSASRTGQNGNRFGAVVGYIATMYGNVTTQELHPMILESLADGLKGLFEYHITKRRLRLTAFPGDPPNQTCFRSVMGSFTEGHLEWKYSPGIALGLIPLVIICLISIALILWTIAQGGELTLFDPTEPVSLIAAAGDGKLRFIPEASRRPPMAERTSSTIKQMPPMLEGGSFNAEQTSPIGDPDDALVKNTNVMYGEEYGTWGLRAKTE